MEPIISYANFKVEFKVFCGDASASKMLAGLAWRPEFDFSDPHLKSQVWWHALAIQVLQRQGQADGRAGWPLSLA